VEELTHQVFELFRRDEKEFWISELLKFSGNSLENGDLMYVKKVLSPVMLHVAIGSLLDFDVAAFSLIICRLGKYMADHDMFSDGNPIVEFDDGLRLKLLCHSSVKISNLTKNLLSVANRICKPLLLKETPFDALALAFMFLKAIAFLKLDTIVLRPFVESIAVKISKSLIEGGDKLSAAWKVLHAQLWRLLQICLNSKLTSRKELSEFVIDALESAHSSYAKLSVILEFLLLKTVDERQKLLPISALPLIYKILERNLTAQSHTLRKVSLEIFSCFESLPFHISEDSTLDGTCDMVQLCLNLENHCENVGLEVEREMIRLLGRVTVLCRSVQTPVIYKKIAVSHLLGLYHVKFATLWPHVADSIAAAMCSEFNETWSIMANELLDTSSRDSSATVVSDEISSSRSNNSMEEVQGTFNTLCNLEMGVVDYNEVTDVITHHHLIWRGLQKFVSHVETKTKFLVPLFFGFLLDQYTVIYLDDFEEPKLQQMKAACEKVSTRDSNYRCLVSQLTTRAIRSKLIDFLNLFAEFKNMKGAYENRLLHEIFFALLMKSDDIILKLALRCLYTFGNKNLNLYKETLNRIVDPATFRDELTNFDISQEGGLVLSEHRQDLLSVLLRILYSKCISKKGRNSGDTSSVRRAVILAYLSSLESNELVLFVELVTRSFHLKITIDEKHLRDRFSLISTESVSASKILGFLNLLEELIAQLGFKLTVFVPVIADLVVSFLQFSQGAGSGMNTLEEDHPDDAVISASSHKQIRSLVYRRLAELVDAVSKLKPHSRYN
jgi:U3 small nucleolar RNA-associated protein 20